MESGACMYGGIFSAKMGTVTRWIPLIVCVSAKETSHRQTEEFIDDGMRIDYPEEDVNDSRYISALHGRRNSHTLKEHHPVDEMQHLQLDDSDGTLVTEDVTSALLKLRVSVQHMYDRLQRTTPQTLWRMFYLSDHPVATATIDRTGGVIRADREHPAGTNRHTGAKNFRFDSALPIQNIQYEHDSVRHVMARRGGVRRSREGPFAVKIKSSMQAPPPNPSEGGTKTNIENGGRQVVDIRV